MSDEETKEPIFIRRRHSEEEETEQHGIWKLAYADFMTAMMAFFLVMWLINSTTIEVKNSIVQYFNPVQLIDANPAHKGLRDPKDAGQGKNLQPTNAPDKPAPERSNSSDKADPLHEAALLADPVTTLEEIARSGVPAGAARSTTALPNQQAPVFGDPFDRMATTGGSTDQRGDNENGVAPASPRSERVEEAASEPRQAPQPAPPPTNAMGAGQQRTPASPTSEQATTPKAASTASMRAALEKIVRSEASELRNVPHLEVTETNEGLLISLTDDANFSMFSVGSIKPKPQLVRILGQVGGILEKQPGEIELRGHTDARSYKSATYDNWRLSSDRANMAYYMLVRGGLDEKRVGKIAGYADRRLKTPKDPLADVNRRIEILIRKGEH
ncbi:MAG: MotB family protein [Methylocystis sp.]|nr:MotB family protein [Methylocystis sp.]